MKSFFTILTFIFFTTTYYLKAQNAMSNKDLLNNKQQNIVNITALTASGNYETLPDELNKALDDGMTITELKEIFLHIYAYAGFPRSISGSYVLMKVVEDRKALGKNDTEGEEPIPDKDCENKFEKGEKILVEVTDQTVEESRSGVMGFNSTLDAFLKEHLFADIFGRNIFSYADRELITITTLVVTTPAESIATQSHFGVGLYNGFSESQLRHLLGLIETNVSKEAAKTGNELLDNALIVGSKIEQ